ncbi:DNA (cytosine-5)-methyltransferase 1 [Methanococcus voltae]|uniref:DNA cytosine methyltransferase n=1 Tax=Methanococcus voltae TaxID=2188 RepID=UPI001AE5AC49|nr:DNA cytosine methyltransferase [Methanococcus voltae]MBP2143888.1 DNA (cytosine-5)-methyltransferase 1 [Methanococcus voltae]
MDNKKTYISLFSGAGIGCYGFKLNNFECIASNELIERRLKIQKFNKKCKYESGYICGDISEKSIKEKLFNELKLWKSVEKITDVDVIIATPPCQGMSVANHKKKKDEIIRNSLVTESIVLVKKIKPKFFIFENVPSFMKTICTDLDGINKKIGEAISENLAKEYSIYGEVINFKNYGACSSRSRTLVIGVRKDLADYISPIELFPDRIKEKTLKETIGHLIRLEDFDQYDPNDVYHRFRAYPKHMRSWISELNEGESAFENKNPKNIPHKIVNGEIVYNKNKNGDKYRRQYWTKVGPCIHTRNDQLASQNTVHPHDDRVFSIRELTLMMTIPCEFKWSEKSIAEISKLSDIEKKAYFKKEELNIRQSIGESVPTEIFKNVSKKISDFLDQKHLKNTQVESLIERYQLNDIDNLKKFIEKNEYNYCIASLSKIAELTNNKRTANSAYYTNKSIINEIVKTWPDLTKDEINILEPSVGVGNFLNIIIKKYDYAKILNIDVVDIDNDSLNILKTLIMKMNIPNNVNISFINADFLKYDVLKKYDLTVGNPPFTKLKSKDPLVKEYSKNRYNNKTTNIFAFFLEKCMTISNYVSMITPKSLLNTPEFELSREYIEKYNVTDIIDFGEYGFKGVLVETICLTISLNEKPKDVHVKSIPKNKKIKQKQKYIFDNKLPYWIIYRNDKFDEICNNMEFGIFKVFRDRQLTNSNTNSSDGIRVLKSRNISDNGKKVLDIPNYDSYVKKEIAENFSVYKYLYQDEVYLTPNMTYNPRVMKKPNGMLVNGSVAILIPKKEFSLTTEEMEYYSSPEYREFYHIARNYQTRSLNIDKTSVYFFGKFNRGQENDTNYK